MRPVVRVGVPVVLVLVAALGLWLVLTGGSDQPVQNASDQLAIEDTDLASIEELAGITVPEGAQDFLTARLDDDSQLDVTFTIDPADEQVFLDDSGLPELVPDERVITHSSPLWDLEVKGTARGATDAVETVGGQSVNREVEFVDEDGRTRVRLVLKASPQQP